MVMTMMILLLMLMMLLLLMLIVVMMVVRMHGNHAAVLGRDKTCLSGGKTTISILEEKYGSREIQTREIEKGNSIGAF